MAINVPPTVTHDSVAEPSWANAVRESVVEIDPNSQNAPDRSVPVSNAQGDGYAVRPYSMADAAYAMARAGLHMGFWMAGQPHGFAALNNNSLLGNCRISLTGTALHLFQLGDGRVALSTGTTSGSHAGIHGPLQNIAMLNPALVFVGGITHTSGRRAHVGWSSETHFSGASDMICFVVDNGNLWARTRANGSTTENNTGAVSNNMRLMIECDNNGGVVRFYRNNILVATHTTNIPQGAIMVSCGVTNTVSGSRDISIRDLYGWYKAIY